MRSTTIRLGRGVAATLGAATLMLGAVACSEESSDEPSGEETSQEDSGEESSEESESE